MKKIIIYLFLITGISFSQNDLPLKWFFFDGGGAGSGTQPTIACASLDYTTGPPFVPYYDAYAQFTTPQYALMWHATEFDMSSSMTYWHIGFDMNYTSGTDIAGLRELTKASYRIYASAGNLYIGLVDSAYLWAPITASAWHRYDVIFDVDSLRTYKDNSLIHAYPTTMANVTPDATTYPAWGCYYPYNTGTFNGGLDNLFMKFEDSVHLNVNFNQGATNQPQDSAEYYYLDRAYSPHGWKGLGVWFGTMWDTRDYYDPQFAFKTIARKDTMKFYQIGYFSYWSDQSYSRRPLSKVIRDPYDTMKTYIVGPFNYFYDSTQKSSRMIARLNGVTGRWDTIGAGLDMSDFALDLKIWKNPVTDSVYGLGLHYGDTVGAGVQARYNYKFNTVTNKYLSMDSLKQICHEMAICNDTLYAHMPTCIAAFDLINGGTWRVDSDTMDSYGEAIGVYHNKIYIGRNDRGIYRRDGPHNYVLVAACNATFTFAYGSFYNDTIQDVLWGSCYENDTLAGVPVNHIWYMDNAGTIHNPGGGVDGFTRLVGGMDSYANAVYNLTRYQGRIWAVGFYRKAGGADISSIAMYDYNTNTWCAPGYATDFGGWGITQFCINDTINKGRGDSINTYNDLMICGDFSAVAGINADGMFAMYSPQHFLDLKPIHIFTNLIDIPATEYPPTFTGTFYSPAQRALTVTCYYKINSGVWKNFTFTKTDSSLSNFDGIKHFTMAGTFGAADTIANNDSISYYVKQVDNLGNVDSSAIDVFRIIYPDYVATPNYIFDWVDIRDSVGVGDSVFVLPNEQDTLCLRQGTGGRRPFMSADGIVFDVTDALFSSTMPHLNAGGEITVMLYMKVTDTNYASEQFIFTYRNDVPNVKGLGLKVQTNGVSPAFKLGTGYHNGVGATYKTYITNLGGHYNLFSTFALYADSTNKQLFKVRGVDGVDKGAGYSTNESTVGFILGSPGGTGGMNGGVIKRVLIYFRKLNDTELATNRTAMTARP